MLEAHLAREDEAKRRAERKRRLLKTAFRLSILGIVAAGGIAAVWYAVRRR